MKSLDARLGEGTAELAIRQILTKIEIERSSEPELSVLSCSARVVIKSEAERTGDVAIAKCAGARKIHCAASNIAAIGCTKRSGDRI